MFSPPIKLLSNLIILVLGFCVIANPSFSNEETELPIVKIGLLASSVHDPRIEIFIDQTIAGIKSDLKNYKVEILPLAQDAFKEALENHEVDYAISDSFFYLSTSASARSEGLSRVASVLLMAPKGASAHIGGALIRKKQSGPTNLESLEGKTIALPSEQDYYGWGALQREIANTGHEPKSFFSKRIFTNSSLNETVLAVLNGVTDLGIIHTCYLENRVDDPRLKGLEVVAKKDIPNSPCQTSTHLYLGWVLAATPRSNPEITREIVKALLSIKDEEGSQWAFGEDFTENHYLFDELDMGQYSEFHRFALMRFISKNFSWFLLAFLMLAGWLFHTVRTNHLIEVRTRALKNAQKERTDLMDKLSNMQKVGVIGLMSSVLAHELKQPIGALRNYIQGLKFQLQREVMTKESVEEAVKEMESQIIRANSIVEKVRGYAKDKKSQKSLINMSSIVEQSLETLRKTNDHLPRIIFKDSKEPIYIEGDKTEIELAIYNILKNAIDACETVRNPTVEIIVVKEGTNVKVEVIDNGPPLSDEEFNALGTPLKTTKADGLGLGFPIANRIAEAHGGRLEFARFTDGRLSVCIHLPLFKT